MKVNRRKLFGVGAGAAVAGPSVLGELATVAATMAAGMGASMPSTPPPYYGDQLAKSPASDPNYAARRIAHLKRIISGESDEDFRDYPTAARYYGPYENLKSVSKSAQFFLTQRLEERRNRQRMIENAIKELAHLDPTGIVRQVL